MKKRSRSGSRWLPNGLVILHEDRDILVVNKPCGLLTMGTERERERTAYFILTDYVRKGNARSRERIFIVHRLDRETSGVLVFAKSEEAKFQLQGHWDEAQKTYLAVVHGHPKAEDTISSYLAENSAFTVYSTPDSARGKLSHTAYRVLKTTREFSLVEIDLITGRKNQIRVHMSDIGHPVVGDKKYGREKEAFGKLALHARSLSIPHPYSGEQLTFVADAPPHFGQLVGSFAASAP